MKAFVNNSTGMIAVMAAVPFTTCKKGAVFGCRPDEAAKLLGQEKVVLVAKGKLPVAEGKEFADLFTEIGLDLEAGKAVASNGKSTPAEDAADVIADLKRQVSDLTKRAVEAENKAEQAAKAGGAPNKAVNAKLVETEKELNAANAKIAALETQVEELTAPKS